MSRSSYPRKAVEAIFQVVNEGNSHGEVCLRLRPLAPKPCQWMRVTAARLSAGFSGLNRPMCHGLGPLSRDERHRMYCKAPLFSYAASEQITGTAPNPPVHTSSLLPNSRPYSPISYPAFFSIVWNMFSFLESSKKSLKQGPGAKRKLERWGRPTGRIVATFISLESWRTWGQHLGRTFLY